MLETTFSTVFFVLHVMAYIGNIEGTVSIKDFIVLIMSFDSCTENNLCAFDEE